MRQRGSQSATVEEEPVVRDGFTVPRSLGRFVVENLIGRGGMSDVYRAFDPALERHVALKVLSPALARDPGLVTRFLREARAAAALDHPNVVRVLETGDDGDHAFIAMQLVQGRDLKTEIAERGPLPLALVVAVAEQAAAGLDHAHDAGLVHRDVKPANLLLDPQGHVYVTDFGLVRGSGSNSGLTRTGELVGTVYYVAPENLEGGGTDRRADVYSLGCVIYECLTGKPVFERDTELAILWAHLNDEPPRASLARRDTPRTVDRVIAAALAKNPEHRFESCSALANALAAALQGIAVDVPVQPRRRAERSLRPQRFLALAAAAMLLTGGAVAQRVFLHDLGARGAAKTTLNSPETGESSRGSQPGGGERKRDSQRRTPLRASGGSIMGRDISAVGPSLSERGDPSLSSVAFPPPGESLGSPVFSRSVEHVYDVTSLVEPARPCPADDTSRMGCVIFSLEPDESWVEVSISDETGVPVGAFLRQDSDADPNWDGRWFPFCGSMPEPIKVSRGARVSIFIEPENCTGEPVPTTGTITARLFRTM